MFAHQVVDDLKIRQKVGGCSYDNGFLEATISDLISSQKFSMGEVENYDSILNRYVGKPMSIDCIKTPYNCCWVDYTFKDMSFDVFTESSFPKRGLLIKEAGGHIEVKFLWFAGHPYNEWLLQPIVTKHDESSFFYTPGVFGKLHGFSDKNDIWKALYQDIKDELHILKLFFDLIHCKNIGTTNNHPPPALNKKRIKSGKQPLFTYKTLVIKPTGKKQEAQAAQGLWDNRVHLCRGHFKTYTDENPLFGKVTGRFWWQSAVRGNSKKGVVMKDYLVKSGPSELTVPLQYHSEGGNHRKQLSNQVVIGGGAGS